MSKKITAKKVVKGTIKAKASKKLSKIAAKKKK